MTRIAWPVLMRAGLVELGLTPEVFWALTPAELLLLAGPGKERDRAMSRDGLAALIRDFPDKANEGGADGGY